MQTQKLLLIACHITQPYQRQHISFSFIFISTSLNQPKRMTLDKQGHRTNYLPFGLIILSSLLSFLYSEFKHKRI